MKILSGMLEKIKPLFEEGGKLHSFHPVFQALDNFLFSAPYRTANPPYGTSQVMSKGQ